MLVTFVFFSLDQFIVSFLVVIDTEVFAIGPYAITNMLSFCCGVTKGGPAQQFKEK